MPIKKALRIFISKVNPIPNEKFSLIFILMEKYYRTVITIFSL